MTICVLIRKSRRIFWRYIVSIREKNWSGIDRKIFDVVIIGGGINGASIYRKLSERGFSVLILDRGDFSSGSSQTSAMMIWGGLLYLRNLDLRAVRSFSKDRDALIASFGDQIYSGNLRYVMNSKRLKDRYCINAALHAYWLLGDFKRKRPAFEKKFGESRFMQDSHDNGSFVYEEGFLKQSDSRFVLNWILSCQTDESVAINYCEIIDGGYNQKDGFWSLYLCDHMQNKQCMVRTKAIVNCAGVWTDIVNKQFNIKSPYKHVFSKGVFLGIPRPAEHHSPLIFEMGEYGDVLTFLPWGPISLWGPTETMVPTIEEGFTVTSEDVDFLIKHARRNLACTVSNSSIISLRCGIRPLVVDKDFAEDCYPLTLSRRFKIVADPRLPWFSVYGGKISGCLSLSNAAVTNISVKIRPRQGRRTLPDFPALPLHWTRFPGIVGRIPSIDWCIEHEFCCTLQDYVRRRTNIAQWLPGEGLGQNGEHKPLVQALSKRLPYGNEAQADTLLMHEKKVDAVSNTLPSGISCWKGDDHAIV